MKCYLLTVLTCFCVMSSFAQTEVSNLPVGAYETWQLNNNTKSAKWSGGNLVLLDDKRYRFGDNSGEYKFSPTAQRIFFVTGELKGAFAQIHTTGPELVILFPQKENERLGNKLFSSDIGGFYRRRD